MPIRILIVDDHGVLRAGLRALLVDEPDLDVVGEARTGQEAITLASGLRPDVILLDITLPDMNGLQVAQELKRTWPEVVILILTVHEDDLMLQEALRTGVGGYIIKRAVRAELLDAIRAVARGELYVHPAMTRALLKSRSVTRSAPIMSAEPLSEPESEILRLIARGNTNRQIAKTLSLSMRTVENYRAGVMTKLGLRTRVELVRYAIDHGLLADGQ